MLTPGFNRWGQMLLHFGTFLWERLEAEMHKTAVADKRIRNIWGK